MSKKIEQQKSIKFAWLGKLVWMLVFIPMGLYFYFGINHLTKFETADEFLWYSQGRIQQYWQAVKDKNWEMTRINDKPGITVALVSGTALLREKEPAPLVDDGNRKLAVFPLEKIEQAHFDYRFPILFLNGIFGLYFYWMLRKITKDKWIALFGSSLILLQPVLIGISQIINPDSLFWSFAIALLLTFLAFLETGQVILVIFAILLMAFTLASKYVGIIFFPFLIFALGIHALFKIPDWEAEEKAVWKRILWRNCAYLLVVAGGIGLFALLMPSSILNPQQLAEGTYDFPGMKEIFRVSIGISLTMIIDALAFKSYGMKFIARWAKYPRIVLVDIFFLAIATLIVLVIADWKFKLDLFGLLAVPFESSKTFAINSLPFYQQLLLEARPFVFASTPLVLGIAIITWLAGIFKGWKNEWLILVLSSFIPIFLIAVIKQNLLVHVRYSIILFPIAVLIAAIGLVEIFNLPYLKRVPKLILFTVLVGLSFISVLKIKPFYFNYTNDLLPKEFSLVDGWGYGGYEAAQYLNSLPNAENIRVITDYTGTCQFFKGPCIRYTDIVRPNFNKRWNAGGYNYFVISKKGLRRFKLREDHPELENKKPVWELKIDDRPDNFVRIVKSDYQPPSNPMGE